MRLQAVDPDLNERIVYSIAPTAGKEAATTFYISGDFLLQNRLLDYENQAERSFFIPVVAEDSGQLRSEIEVPVRLTDCNDNYPTIQIGGVDGDAGVSLTENDGRELTLAQVMASDPDAGDNGTVECQATPSDRFRLVRVPLPSVPAGDQARRMTIYELRKPNGVTFDREASPAGKVTVDISCTDRGAPPKITPHQLTVRITDVNDNPPHLERSFYSYRLSENNPLDAFVGHVRADDPDDPTAPLRFDLDAAGRQFFSIQSTGRGRAEIRARVTFDREERSRYNFAVIVSDNDGRADSLSATASVEVVIEDVDDSPPVFQPPVYSFHIVEDFGANYSRRFIGAVTATDADSGANAEIRYKVGNRQSSTDIHFSFEGNQLMGQGNFDRERQETLLLEVQAVGANAFASAQVTIALLDVNDNWPILEGLSRVHNLSAASPAGTQLLPQARGRDDDAGDNGTIVYSLEEKELSVPIEADGGGTHFSIDRTHGMLTLIRPFKRGVGRRFRLTLLARDCGQPPLESRHDTLVHIVDAAHAARSGVAGSGPGGVSNGKDAHGGEDGGAAGGRTQRAQADRNLLLLLCLAAVVFVIFVALLAVLLYMHAWGRQETSRTAVRTNRGATWYDRANSDPRQTADEPSADLSEGAYRFPDILTDGCRSATLVIDNARARSPGGTCLKRQRKFSSSGYLTSPQRQTSANSTPDGGGRLAATHQRSLTLKAFNGYETTATSSPSAAAATSAAAALTSSDRMSRKFYATISGDATAAGAMEESRYTSAAAAPAIDRQGYAVLASDTALAAAGRDAASGAHVGSPICRTPYATSSFV
ncbi:hypothetical protein BOX15_Mlig020121g2 [Macrostomum lignano]|uniref:Cadherin domain-containing protein n=2 Tax=Macrostomum lignano TaxID=282301 RepID=A0A267FQD6_9PLAT|nr:hypothetical protein BOX15_Mlig020121g2 [Macrostomum lignano]